MEQNEREMLTIELSRLQEPDANPDSAPAEETFEMRERAEKRLRRTGRQARKQMYSGETRSSES